MAEYIPSRPQLSINSVDLTNWLRSAVSVESTADEIDTSSAASDTRTYGSGLKQGRFRCTLKQSYEANGPDVTLRGLLGQSVAVTTRPTHESMSATNPQSAFNVIVTSIPMASGRIGELSEFSIDWPINGAVTVTP